MNIIAVDDEKYALDLLYEAISEALPEVVPACFGRAAEALAYAREHRVDVAFLDVQMKEMDGLALAQELTEIRPNTNIIFVTGYSDYLEEAFQLYASGYVRKPVLAARIKREINNLRFPLKAEEDGRLPGVLGPYRFDHITQRVYYRGEDTLLKPREYQLFRLFASQPGRCFSAPELYQRIWGDAPQGSVHTVSVHISSLRKKLHMDEANNPIIKNRRGEGFYLDLDA